jgi:DNA-directed RNA polymerase specialized sigma24 family protein
MTKTKKYRKIKRPSSGKKPYFTKDTQAAIKKYVYSDDEDFRAKIYEKDIEPALNKLSENLIFVYGFHKQHPDANVLKQDCVINLYENLHKFNHDLGKNAFSYFNVVAKNWLIIQSRRRKKRVGRLVYIDDNSLSIADKYAVEEYQIAPSPDRAIEQTENIEAMKRLLCEIKNKAKNDSEKKCVDAILQIFGNLDQLDYLNKRAIFVYVREISGLNSKQLSVCMSSLRKTYRDLVGPDKKYDIF